MDFTSWKFNIHIIFAYRMTCNFLNKFWYPHQSSVRNIFLRNHPRMCKPWLVFGTYYLQSSWYDISWKFTLRILLDKSGLYVASWMRSDVFFWKYFLVYNFFLVSTSVQAMTLNFECNKSNNGIVCNFRLE